MIPIFDPIWRDIEPFAWVRYELDSLNIAGSFFDITINIQTGIRESWK